MKNALNRRSFLKKSLLVGGTAITLPGIEDKVLGAELKAGKSPDTPQRPVDPLKLPTGKIKHLDISRVICGGNLIGGWAHSRDLMYVSPLIKAYHTDEKVFQTLHLAEQRGVNTVLTNPSSSRVLKAYRDEHGGQIQWISDCATSDLKEGIRHSIDNGADAVYLQGGLCDKMVRDGKFGELEAILKFMQKERVPHGLGAHSLETVKQCVKAGFEPDFWVKTLHQDNYWSATPQANRGVFDEVSGSKPQHHLHHDNMWCSSAPETISFMAKLKKPWIAFKVLAAGAIHPRQAFQWAFESGADFICVGMFDFQVVENTALAERALAAVTQKGRARPWMA